jgi:hypothetical protein
MKWLEIIEIRSKGSNRRLIMKQLKVIVKEVRSKNEQQKIKVYNHGTIDGDFSLHLLHDTKGADINGSVLGIQLTSALKELGLVNHTIWIEKHDKE